MAVKEKIVIDEIDGKRFKIHFFQEEDNRKAIITHYLHNYNNGIKDHFEEKALEYIKQIVEYKNENESLNILEDSAIQQFLF